MPRSRFRVGLSKVRRIIRVLTVIRGPYLRVVRCTGCFGLVIVKVGQKYREFPLAKEAGKAVEG